MFVSDNDETLSPDENLTGDKVPQENTPGSSEPQEETKTPEELEKALKGFQRDQQKSREREKVKDRKIDELTETIDSIKAAEKQKKLEGMDEVTRYKTMADDAVTEKGKLEMRIVVNEALEGRNLPQVVVDILRNAPWAIPTVKAEIGEQFTYEDAIASLKRHLPAYLDSFEVGNDDPATEDTPDSSNPPVDTERSNDETTVVKNHFYTRAEINKIAADPAEWEKHGPKILAQVEEHGGTVPEVA